jgi:hypothetical protein
LDKPTATVEIDQVDAATISYALWFAGILMKQDGFPEAKRLFDEARESLESRFETVFGSRYHQRIKDTGLFEIVKKEMARRSTD